MTILFMLYFYLFSNIFYYFSMLYFLLFQFVCFLKAILLVLLAHYNLASISGLVKRAMTVGLRNKDNH